jgi:hypothetical protein
MEAMAEATVDTEHAIKTMAPSNSTTPSRTSSLELRVLMDLRELLVQKGDTEEDLPVAMVEGWERREALATSRRRLKRLLLHWILMMQLLRSEDTRYCAISFNSCREAMAERRVATEDTGGDTVATVGDTEERREDMVDSEERREATMERRVGTEDMVERREDTDISILKQLIPLHRS